MADGKVTILTELVTDGIKTGLKAAAGMIAGAGTALAGLGTAAINVGMQFESGMAQVAATMGITKDTIDKDGVKPFDVLSKAAKDAGATTKYTATEAAEGLNYLALAGYDAQTAADTLPAVLNLASAGGLDLAYASDLATDAMAALGIEASNANLTQFGDKMAKTASKANTSVGQLGEAILTVGGTAKGLAGGTTELNAALGVLANRGIKGSEGGTALRNVILSLTAPTDKAAKTMKSLGLEVNDAQGNMRPLNEVFKDLDKSLSGMSNSEKTQVLNEIFNKVDLKSAQALLAGCGTEFDDLAAAINDSDGAMQQMADTMNDTLEGQITILKSGLEGLGIEVYESVQEPLKNLAKEAQTLVSEMTTAFKSGGFEGLAESVGSVLSTAVSKIVDAAPKFVEAASLLLNGLLTGLTKNASNIASGAATAAASLAKGVMSALPQMLTAGASMLTALIKGIAQQLPSLINTAVTVAVQLVEGLIKALPKLISAGILLITSLVDGIVKAIPKVIAAIPKLITGLISALTRAVPQLIRAGVVLLSSLVKDLPSIISAIVKAIPEIISAYIGGLGKYAASIVVAGVELFGGLVKAIPQIIWELLKAIPQIIFGIVEGLLRGVTSVLAAAVQLFLPIKEQAGITAEQMEAAGEKAGTFAQALQDASPAATDFSNAVSKSGNSVSDLEQQISDCEKKITDTIAKAYKDQGALRKKDLDDVENYTKEWVKKQQEMLSIYTDNQNQILSEAREQATTLTVEQYADLAARSEAAQKESLQKLEEAKKGELSILYQKHKAAGTLESEAYSKELAALDDKYAKEQSKIKEYTNQTYQTILSSAQLSIAATQRGWSAMGTEVAAGVTKAGGILGGIVPIVKHTAQLATSEFSSGVSGIPDAGSGAILGAAIKMKANGSELSDASKKLVKEVLTPFQGLQGDAAEAGKNTLLGMISGMEGELSGVDDTSNMTADAIVTAIENSLGIQSPSRVLAEIGAYAIQGLVLGLQSGQGEPAGVMEQVGTSIQATLLNGGLSMSNMSAIGLNAMVGLASGARGAQGSVTGAASGIGSATVSALKNSNLNSGTTSGIGKAAINGLASGAKSAQGNVTGVASGIGSATANTLKNGKMSSGTMSGIGKTAIGGLASGAKNAQGSVTGVITGIAGAMARALIAGKMSSAAMASVGKTSMNGLTSGIKNGQASVINAVKSVGTQGQSTLKNGGLKASAMSSIGSSAVRSVASGANGARGSFTSTMRSIGSAAASGMRSGMNSQVSSLVALAHSIAKKVTNAFKAKLQIKSPSRVMAREIGAPMAMGVGVGFERTMNTVLKNMERSVAMENSRVPVGAAATRMRLTGIPQGAGGARSTYNITNNVQSPVPTTVAQSAREANKMTENTLFKLGVYGV